MSRRQVARDTRGFYAIGIIGSKTPENLGTLWRSALIYDAALVFTVGKRYPAFQAADTTKTARHIPLVHYTGLDDLVGHLPHSCPLVGVELHPGARPLTHYSHRIRAAYLLGAEDTGLPPRVAARCHELVQIETAKPWSLNVAVAGSILLHDRHVKALAAAPPLAEGAA